MALRLALGNYRPAKQPDPLGRDYIGYFPRMTEAEAWQAGRGVWPLDQKVVARERFTLITGQGVVRAIAEIGGLSVHGDKKAVEGRLLAPGHPMYDAYFNRPDPLANASRNSVTYGDLPEEEPFRLRPCGCGCGQDVERAFVPGHELRAIQSRVREHFGGDVLAFVTWVDKQLPDGGTAA